MSEPDDNIDLDNLPDIGELPDFDIQFEERPRSPACLLIVALATPILLVCSLAVLAGLVLVIVQLGSGR